MNLKQLEAFVKIADTGSFSKAAKELFLTQPTVSAHISALEKELNARLFVRNTKEVALSQEGHLLYGYAKQMVDLEKEAKHAFAVADKTWQKNITIAASTIPAQYLLPEVLAKFAAKYPDEQFKVCEMDSAKVVEQLKRNAIDIGFTGTVLEKKNCKYIPFYEDELIIIAPNTEKYSKLKEEHKDIRWILEEPVIMREEGSGTRRESERQLKQSGIDIREMNVVASIENPEVIKKSVCSGMGISIISKLAAKEEVADGRVIEIQLPANGSRRNLNMVYNKNVHITPSAERFMKVVKEVYGVKR